MLAGVRAAALPIAAKRLDAIASEVAVHIKRNTEDRWGEDPLKPVRSSLGDVRITYQVFGEGRAPRRRLHALGLICPIGWVGMLAAWRLGDQSVLLHGQVNRQHGPGQAMRPNYAPAIAGQLQIAQVRRPGAPSVSSRANITAFRQRGLCRDREPIDISAGQKL
jgi:hypothetical protein